MNEPVLNQFTSGSEMNIAKDQGTAIQTNVHLHLPKPITPPLIRPRRPDHFTNRVPELDHLFQQLQPGCVVTLCGAGGIGKSALASEAIWRLTEKNALPTMFADGVLWHDFYQEPNCDVALEAIARTFGEEPVPNARLAAQRALSGKSVLLLLDGTEKADKLSIVLTTVAHCGVIVTSRKRQDAITMPYQLDVLDLENAVTLLQRLSAVTDRSILTQICQQIACLPLAIRLVAHYLHTTGESPELYLTWIQEQPFEALTLPNAQHHDESVNLLLRRSLEQLSVDARQVLSVVGALAFAPFGAELFVSVLATDVRRCRTALRELVNFGLLRCSEDRYEVSHALIHAYARKQIALDADSFTRLAEHYQKFASAQQQQGRTGFARLDTERTHIMQILETCQEQAMWPSVSALVGKMDTYLDRQGYWSERQAALNMNRIAAQQQTDRNDEAWCVNNLGLTCLHRGDYATALTYLEQSLTIRREIGDKAGEGTTLNNLATTAYAGGDYATALTYLEQSLTIQREIGDKAGEGTTLNNLSQIYDARGDYATALTYLEQSLTIQREIGDKAGMCATLFNMGHIHFQNKELQEALEAWGAVYRLAKPSNLAQALKALDNLAGQLGLPGGSEAWEDLANQRKEKIDHSEQE